MSSRKLNKASIDAFFRVLEAQNPHPQSELQAPTPFTFLVAVILSAQATDKGVNKATRPLFEVAKTPQDFVALGEEKLQDFIKTIGLHNAKAKNIIGAAAQIISKHGGVVPSARADLMALPGVGRKTANVVLNALWGEPTIAVDTHVFRVANRTGLALGKTPHAVEKGLISRIPERFLRHAHHWLILLGRYICKARKPLCKECPVVHICTYPHKDL